jgi:hypothetical protein
MDTKRVIVYILSGQPTPDKIRPIDYLFQDPLFEPKVVTIDEKNNPAPVAPSNSIADALSAQPVDASGKAMAENWYSDRMSLKEKRDAHRYHFCMKDAQKNYPHNPMLIVKDSTKSNASPGRVAQVVSGALTKKDWDICYLCNWGEDCENLTDKKTVAGTMTTLAKTKSPNGLQATLMTPKARDTLLNNVPLDKPLPQKVTDMVKDGKLQAVTTVPNLLEYDINDVKSTDDYLRTHLCKVGKKSMFESSGWTWLILIIIILVLIGLFIMYKRKHY